MPAVKTAIERVVAPVDQTYPPADVAEEVSVIPVPGHMLVEPLVEMVGTGGVVVVDTVVAVDVAVQDPEA